MCVAINDVAEITDSSGHNSLQHSGTRFPLCEAE